MTTTGSDRRRHVEELESERAVNEDYVKYLRDVGTRQPAIAMPRSSLWTSPRVKTPASRSEVNPLFGRVALDGPVEHLTDNFYIGSWHRDSDGIVVISWAAPKAALFFEGTGADDRLAEHITARRTFESHGLDLSDFVDDVEPGANGAPPFPRTGRRIDIPAPPTAPRKRPRVTAVRPDSRPEPRPTGTRPTPPAKSPSPPKPAPQPKPEPPPEIQAAATSSTAKRTTRATAAPLALRAESAVRRSVERLRSGHLGSVLATLQADQHRLVTWPDNVPLVVQGQPGTGKTIVATHRAAYLVHPQREDGRPLESVLIVGPTDEHRTHVNGALRALAAEGVTAQGLPSLLRTLAGITGRQEPDRHDRIDSLWDLGRVVDRATRHLKRSNRLSGDVEHRRRTVVEALIRDAPLRQYACRGSSDANEMSRWLESLKSYDQAMRSTGALPFLASVALATGALGAGDRFGHLIVDEAQDVRPLEWRVLLQLLGRGASVSLFGDMNQRRSDWSPESWERLVEDLELAPEDAPLPIEELTLGYRSTRQILTFANRLLPRGRRKVHAIRDGPEPRVKRTGTRTLFDMAVTEAGDLATTYEGGLVGVITMAPQPIADRFRARGWKRGHLRHSWQEDRRTVVVLHPDNARGLEFDGVVVVEPTSFPTNLDQSGLLYTSLTRGTKELVVLYSKSLPPGLRRRR